LTAPAEPAWECFLGGDDEILGPALGEAARRVVARPAEAPGELRSWIERRLAPRDLLGIVRYGATLRIPVDLDLLVERAGLLGLAPAEVVRRLPSLRG
jgi:hypothetical protein